MHRQIRKVFPDIGECAHVLDQDSVQPRLVIWFQIGIQIPHFFFFDESIDCHIDPASVNVHKIDRLYHRLLIQVVRISARAKPASADVDCVRSRVHRCHHTLVGAGRCEDLNRSVLHLVSFFTSGSAAGWIQQLQIRIYLQSYSRGQPVFSPASPLSGQPPASSEG